MLSLVTDDLFFLSRCFRCFELSHIKIDYKLITCWDFYSYQEIVQFAEVLFVAASKQRQSFKWGRCFLVSPKCDLFGHSWILEEKVLLQTQPTNEAVRGRLHLGPNQDSNSRSVRLCCVRSTPRRRWSGLGMGRKISKKQSFTAEDAQIMERDSTR